MQHGDGAFGSAKDEAGDLCGERIDGAYVVYVRMREQDAANGRAGGGFEDGVFRALEVGVDERVAVVFADEVAVHETEAGELQAVLGYGSDSHRGLSIEDVCALFSPKTCA